MFERIEKIQKKIRSNNKNMGKSPKYVNIKQYTF